MYQQANQRRPLTLSNLLHVKPSILQRSVHPGIIMDNSVLHDLLKLGLGHSERSVDFVEGEHEVASHDLHCVQVVRDACDRPDLTNRERR